MRSPADRSIRASRSFEDGQTRDDIRLSGATRRADWRCLAASDRPQDSTRCARWAASALSRVHRPAGWTGEVQRPTRASRPELRPGRRHIGGPPVQPRLPEQLMELGRLNHVGIATPSIEKSVALYRDMLGATKIHEPFDLPPQGVRVCFVDTPNSQIELIEPLGENSPLHGFLAKNPGGGQHHVRFSSDGT